MQNIFRFRTWQRRPPHWQWWQSATCKWYFWQFWQFCGVFIELCSGCGILSATINALGFDVMAVDHNHNKLRLRIKTFNLDLTDILVINATSYWWSMRHELQCTRNQIIGCLAWASTLAQQGTPVWCPGHDWQGQSKSWPSQHFVHAYVWFLHFSERQKRCLDNGKSNEQLALGTSVHGVFGKSNVFHIISFMCPWREALQSDQLPHQQPCFLDFVPAVRWTARNLPWGIDEASQQFSTALEAECPKCLCE